MSNSEQREIICPRCKRKVAYRDKKYSIEFYPHDYDVNLPCSQPPIKKVFDVRALEEERLAEELLAQEIVEALRLTIPHQWARDEHGHVELFELGDHHDGPKCVRCNEIFCRNCNPEQWGEPCEEQTQNLF